jgi:hypothetical protein
VQHRRIVSEWRLHFERERSKLQRKRAGNSKVEEG